MTRNAKTQSSIRALTFVDFAHARVTRRRRIARHDAMALLVARAA
jgi:hypothetical protein